MCFSFSLSQVTSNALFQIISRVTSLNMLWKTWTSGLKKNLTSKPSRAVGSRPLPTGFPSWHPNPIGDQTFHWFNVVLTSTVLIFALSINNIPTLNQSKDDCAPSVGRQSTLRRFWKAWGKGGFYRYPVISLVSIFCSNFIHLSVILFFIFFLVVKFGYASVKAVFRQCTKQFLH